MASSDRKEELRKLGLRERSAGGCGRNCLSKCCLLQGAQLPLYTFRKTDKVLDELSENNEPRLSFLNRLLEQWEDRMHKGLFHYDITAYESKVIQGEWGFIAQLIEGRDIKKRPTEFRIDKVLQPFDEKKFNFTKIRQEEALFRFEESENNNAKYFHDAAVVASSPLNVIAINVSPIGYGHVLLIPRILDLFPQRIDRESFLLSLYMAKEAGNPFFRVGYNSLGAFATINHLHFQAYYLPKQLPAEKAPTEEVVTLRCGVRILRLLRYPVRGFVFECGTSLQDLSDTISSVCTFLQNSNNAYNVLISDSGKRIFLFLQCYAEKRACGEVCQEMIDTQVNPAVWEISGSMVLKRRKDYDEASEGNVCNFLSEASLPEERFKELESRILEAIQEGEADKSLIDEEVKGVGMPHKIPAA